MPGQIGRITVPETAPSGTFPLKPDYGYGYAEDPQVAVHQFLSGNAKIEQRFVLGAGVRKYHFHRQYVKDTDRVALRDFWESHRGYQRFTYNAPSADGTGTAAVTVRFADSTIVFEAISCRETTLDFNLIEAPSAVPTYTLNGEQERFPSGALAAALASQVQEFIPLIRIRVKEAVVPDVYLSDRRVVVGETTYLPRLLDWSGIGQSIEGDADQASFTFGDADHVMTDLANDTKLAYADVEFALFHTGTGIKLNLWKGVAGAWSKPSPTEFQMPATDGLYELTLPYPPRKISKTCWKPLGNPNCCPYVGELGECDKGFDTETGCQVHGMDAYFGGQPAHPQGVRIKDNGQGTWGFGRPTITATSIVNDSVFSEVVPEVYTDSEMPINAKVVSGREESDFYDALGIVSEGPLTAYSRDPYGCPKHTLDGQVNHGMEDAIKRNSHDPNDPKNWYGLWESLGADPTTDPFGLHAMGVTPVERAAGTAFVEIRRTDPKGTQLSMPSDHQMQVFVKQGMKGWVWTAPGVRAQQVLSNPIWIAANAVLRARGLRFADAATCEQYVDIPSAIAAAAVCDQQAPVLCGVKSATGTQIEEGSNILDATTNWFSQADVGKSITVPGAGNGGADLTTYVAGFTGPTELTLGHAAGTSVSNVTSDHRRRHGAPVPLPWRAERGEAAQGLAGRDPQ